MNERQRRWQSRFQFLGIPPKGEQVIAAALQMVTLVFPISRDPPEGGTTHRPNTKDRKGARFQFLGIPPKGELEEGDGNETIEYVFPISRDPPEGGTYWLILETGWNRVGKRFQFLGIPPKGEHNKGEEIINITMFPISRDPPEGGTIGNIFGVSRLIGVSNF